MLIFIGPACSTQITTANSNTSHVNLYLPAVPLSFVKSRIQIHLMLIFIVMEKEDAAGAVKFKYISC